MSESYAEVKARLDEIVEAVSDEDLPLDEALALYEEAVKLGNKVSNLIETDIALRDEQVEDGLDGATPVASVSADAGKSDSATASGEIA